MTTDFIRSLPIIPHPEQLYNAINWKGFVTLALIYSPAASLLTTIVFTHLLFLYLLTVTILSTISHCLPSFLAAICEFIFCQSGKNQSLFCDKNCQSFWILSKLGTYQKGRSWMNRDDSREGRTADMGSYIVKVMNEQRWLRERERERGGWTAGMVSYNVKGQLLNYS